MGKSFVNILIIDFACISNTTKHAHGNDMVMNFLKDIMHHDTYVAQKNSKQTVLMTHNAYLCSVYIVPICD